MAPSQYRKIHHLSSALKSTLTRSGSLLMIRLFLLRPLITPSKRYRSAFVTLSFATSFATRPSNSLSSSSIWELIVADLRSLNLDLEELKEDIGFGRFLVLG